MPYPEDETPRQMAESVIIPVIKKPSFNPNEVSSYRPITVSSLFSKIAESIMMPDVDKTLSSTQFGFRPERDTTMACSYLNDIIVHFNSLKSPAYVCSLDAEKCFDKIWHAGLFFKLLQLDILPIMHWAFLVKWYRSSVVVVRWKGELSQPFRPSRGTKQGFPIVIQRLHQ